MFRSYFERKNDNVLTFNIIYVPNFEIGASIKLAPPSNKRRAQQLQNLMSPEALIRGNSVILIAQA